MYHNNLSSKESFGLQYMIYIYITFYKHYNFPFNVFLSCFVSKQHKFNHIYQKGSFSFFHNKMRGIILWPCSIFKTITRTLIPYINYNVNFIQIVCLSFFLVMSLIVLTMYLLIETKIFRSQNIIFVEHIQHRNIKTNIVKDISIHTSIAIYHVFFHSYVGSQGRCAIISSYLITSNYQIVS